ncbi:hypothetical protein I551_7923 [Mycobacterium ulcerans str. Harvey]|uniref:Uncharacterized protein n=1 Tax=Mycobacterium ulcerans str. Harvey TaxID=1299332 RepID=A0ABP3A751_MYCUL|nr:hypothetical protein I551_7923 [Mycobacterium ulcerans str. Harvey]
MYPLSRGTVGKIVVAVPVGLPRRVGDQLEYLRRAGRNFTGGTHHTFGAVGQRGVGINHLPIQTLRRLGAGTAAGNR